jgi:phosphoglycerate dehydrogenase-like enzyme
MSAGGLPRIWFERVIPDGLEGEVARVSIPLGPGREDEPYAGLADAAAAMASSYRYDAELMDRAPLLRVISRTGIGYDLVDIAEATRRGIAVCNTPDAPTVSTAEHAVTLMLAVAKDVKRSEGELGRGVGGYYARHAAVELDGKTLGLVGFGRIARRVAQAGRGLGMRVTAHDPYLPADAFGPEVDAAASLHELLATADVVSVHVPLAASSRGMFGAAEFARMRPGAIFVNTARGGLVDHDALLDALDAGHLHGAGLDVTDPEPLPVGHPLLARDDVVVTPHVASGTIEGKIRIFRDALTNALDALAGRRPATIVNPEAWDAMASTAAAER